MSIEDRSLDALKEGGTVTFIDGSDYGWNAVKHKLCSMNETGDVDGHFLHVDSDGSLKANGGKDSDNIFTVYANSVQLPNGESRVVVMLEHDKTKKVVALRKDPDEVYLKTLPEGTTLSDFNNLSRAKNSQPNILFYKIPRTVGSELFHLQSYLDDQKNVGFDADGNPMRPSAVDLRHDASLFKMCTS